MRIFFTALYCLLIAQPLFSQSIPSRPERPLILGRERSQDGPLQVELMLSKLNHPWSMIWLPQRIAGETARKGWLISERNGRLWVVLEQGPVLEVEGLPPQLSQRGQGGLLGLYYSDVLNKYFLSYSKRITVSTFSLATVSFDLAIQPKSAVASNWQEVFLSNSPQTGHYHYGGAITGDQEWLYISVGERRQRQEAQNPQSDLGSIVRIPLRGGTAAPSIPGALPEIYSIGHRNPQGLYYDLKTRRLWSSEHGPQGGDELNLILAGRNYGWPVVSYGGEYGSGKQVGEGHSKPGMEEPLRQWTPSPAFAGIVGISQPPILESHRERNGSLSLAQNPFANWQGDILIASLKAQTLYRVSLSNSANGIQVSSVEPLLSGRYGRLRWVGQGPDSWIYILTDEPQGKLLRLRPEPR